MAITLASPSRQSTTGDVEDISSLRRELMRLQESLESVQLENGALTNEVKRCRKRIRLLANKRNWVDRLMALLGSHDEVNDKYN